MKLKEKPAAMVGPTIIGLWGLVEAVIGYKPFIRWFGLAVFGMAVIFWIIAFTVEPDNKTQNRWAVAAVASVAIVLGFTVSAVTR